MNNFSKFERYVARFLSHNAILKKVAKRLYQVLIFTLYKEKSRIDTNLSIEACGSIESAECFFGYYDKSPNNSLDQIILIEITTTPYDFIPSAYLRVHSGGEIIYSEKIDAFNYQQGCRAHWISDQKFIFNYYCHSSQKVVSKVVSVDRNFEAETMPFPVQDSYKDEFYVSISYKRINTITPEYGYKVLGTLTSVELNCLTHDGLWIVEMSTGAVRHFIALKLIVNQGWRAEFQNSQHLINHVMISPNGLYCIFIHRYFRDGRRSDRLLYLDLTSYDISILVDSGFVSHCCWLDDSKIFGFFRSPDGVDCYQIIDLETLTSKKLADGFLDKFGDGHPTVKGDLIVFDTYPDRARMQSLIVFNWKTNDWSVLGRFFSGLRYVESNRCDLHPRFSKVDNTIFIDSAYSGRRQLYRIKLDGL